MTKIFSTKNVQAAIAFILTLIFFYLSTWRSIEQVTVLFTEALCLVLVPLYAISSDRGDNLGFRREKLMKQLLLGIICGFLLYILLMLVDIAFEYAGGFVYEGMYLRILRLSWNWIGSILFTQFFHAVCKEIFFRGYMTGYLMGSAKERTKVLWVLFLGLAAGLMQTVLEPGMQLTLRTVADCILTSGVEIAIGLLYIKSKDFTLLSAIAMHMVYGCSKELLVWFL